MASDLSKKLQKIASSSSKKSDKPTLSNMKSLVDQTVSMKKELEDLNAQYASTEGALIEEARKVYDKARTDKQYASSILAEGDKTDGCMVIFQDKFSNLPIETEAELRKLDKEYDKHFVEARKLEVKRTGKTIPDEIIKKLMKAIGETAFSEIFNVKIEIGTAKGLAEMYDELPKEVQDMLTQAKASVRNITPDGKVI
jgi:nitrogen fixation/metabolism regulation signal transduction histidine kinase